ncbi:patatin-like phospholipase family protein [Taibaiella chishuiensis]|uniref:NTE family protein n=1 Tax=Taibaiella chishuiensis TaxID=1434707 RepID=A0A2P8DAF5_9BACT|nr:patatin-like phospholipase family protein [Taibaiella chishuiensis]PSK94206.1 NTE family protein [Taibaiella chishuiensis]
MSAKSPHQNKKQLTPDDFKNDPRVSACVDQVRAHPKIVSDVLGEQGEQYVNLVQKGGGVLGVALVGYVYVLEQAGIRFLKLAGTSAGAINTSLMAIQEDKSKTKSDYLISALADLDLFRLVDGHPFARMLIRGLVQQPDFMKRIRNLLRNALIFLALILVSAFVLLGLQHKYPVLGLATCFVFILIGLYVLVAGVTGAYVSSLLKRLKTAGFGINPGDFFYDWVKAHMKANGIHTVGDLEARAATAPALKIRSPRKEPVADLKGDVVFIASELVTQNKFEFPAMANLFRTADKMNELQPAGFVRASMSIPVFFESYYIKDIPGNDAGVNALWEEQFNLKAPPDTVRFVDGGILSNFPVNVFYNKDIEVPRLPTLGIDLDDSKPGDKQDEPEQWSFAGYLGRMFNTVRFYYDKDFGLKNRIMNLGVGKVPVAEYNWLNFFLTNEQKIDLFAIGAEAARKFLDEFDWSAYKGDRQTFFLQQQNES